MRYLLHLDDYHLDDLLFVQSLGRLMNGARRPLVLVHGSGGGVERLLEAEGFFPDVQDGWFANLSAEWRPLVEQGLRQTNRTLVSKLTDSGVSAVGLHGADRRLVRRIEAGELVVGDVSWMQTLVGSGAVPVVSALVAGVEGSDLADAGAVGGALAQALGSVMPVVLTRTERAGLGQPPVSEASAADLDASAAELADAPSARALLEACGVLLVTSAPAFFAPQGPSGTRIVT